MADGHLRVCIDFAQPAEEVPAGDRRGVATEIALRGRHEIADWAERILALTPTPAEEVLV